MMFASDIPEELWMPLVDKMKASTSQEEIINEVFDMHEKVEQYLSKTDIAMSPKPNSKPSSTKEEIVVAYGGFSTPSSLSERKT